MIISVVFLSIGALLCTVYIEAATPYVCHASDNNPYLLFGTKTSYEFTSGRKKDNEQRGFEECKTMQVWMVARHGTRYPSETEMVRFSNITDLRNEIIRNYLELKTTRMCDKDLSNLQKWNFIWKRGEDEDKLTQQGKQDILLLAKRLRTRFIDLFSQTYSERDFTFRHTSTTQTKSTAEAFADGLFSSQQVVRFSESSENDTLLRSYKNCAAWRDQVDENPDTLKPMENYLSTQDFENMASDISIRLGFKYNLKQEVLLYAYDLCRYEKAVKINAISPWCALFTTDELKMIEYAEDLRYYYNSGYGNRLNAKVGCSLLKDMMNRFRRVAAGATTEPLGVFYFTHQTSLLTLLTRMDLFNDLTPLTASNYPQQMKRMWQTSSISPFGANLIAVFLNCSLPRAGGSEFKVAFYLQEKIIPIKGCDVGLCSWNFLKDKYMQIAEDCNIDRICSGQDGASQIELSFLAFVASILILFLTKR